jgi:hypothetical protein
MVFQNVFPSKPFLIPFRDRRCSESVGATERAIVGGLGQCVLNFIVNICPTNRWIKRSLRAKAVSGRKRNWILTLAFE